MKGILAAANCAACSIMAWRPSGATIPSDDVLGNVGHLVEVGVLHCAGMKGRDLIVVQIGGDEGLRRESVRR